MDTLSAYFAPLLLINGVGLLILSTSQRYLNVKADIQKGVAAGADPDEPQMQAGMACAHMFHRALIGLYLSIGLFSSSALIGSLVQKYPGIANFILHTFTIAGVACVVYAAIQLILESFISIEVIRRNVKD